MKVQDFAELRFKIQYFKVAPEIVDEVWITPMDATTLLMDIQENVHIFDPVTHSERKPQRIQELEGATLYGIKIHILDPKAARISPRFWRPVRYDSLK